MLLLSKTPNVHLLSEKKKGKYKVHFLDICWLPRAITLQQFASNSRLPRISLHFECAYSGRAPLLHVICIYWSVQHSNILNALCAIFYSQYRSWCPKKCQKIRVLLVDICIFFFLLLPFVSILFSIFSSPFCILAGTQLKCQNRSSEIDGTQNDEFDRNSTYISTNSNLDSNYNTLQHILHSSDTYVHVPHHFTTSVTP